MARQFIPMKEFCEKMNCTPREAYRWTQQGMPRHRRGFDLAECQHWHLVGYWEQHQTGGEDNKE